MNSLISIFHEFEQSRRSPFLKEQLLVDAST